MGSKTGIEWTDSTWNPLRGCSRVSEGCRNCYAERQAHRFSEIGQPFYGFVSQFPHDARWTGKVELVEKHLLDPLKWKLVQVPCADCQEALAAGVIETETASLCWHGPTRPRRIFVNSMSDLFHENVTINDLARICAVMVMTPQHIYQVLTKRALRMMERITWLFYNEPCLINDWIDQLGGNPDGWSPPLPNIWLGVSVENQATADERIPLLLQAPAAVRFISAEPLLGALDIHLPCQSDYPLKMRPVDPGIDWVICGGESGPGARPMDVIWARSLRDQCQTAGVPFFFKQWGEWLPAMCDGATDRKGARVLNASDNPVRVGKKAAGALLDGREWKQFPEVRA